VLQGTKHVRAPKKRRTSENSVKASFGASTFHALECIDCSKINMPPYIYSGPIGSKMSLSPRDVTTFINQ
jgi:hypothetical protein